MRLNSLLVSTLLVFTISMQLPLAADELQRPEKGKKIKVFLFGGQSNMEGRADGALVSGDDKARLEKAQERVQLAYNKETLKPLDVVVPEPHIARGYKRDLIFGPELFFGIALSELWPDEKILLIKRTQGGTSLYGCWNPEWTKEKAALMDEQDEPKLYSELVAYTRKALSNYAPDQYEICAMLWVQGESDSSKEETAAAYGDNLRLLIDSIRKDVAVDDLPFLLFQVGDGKVVEGMKETAANTKNVTLLPQSLNPESPDFYAKMENGHYNYEGLKQLGQRFAETFVRQYGSQGK